MDLNKLYKEIEEAEVNLNAKRLKHNKISRKDLPCTFLK